MVSEAYIANLESDFLLEITHNSANEILKLRLCNNFGNYLSPEFGHLS
jgi:hypothetical protein